MNITVVKRNGDREAYDANKINLAIEDAANPEAYLRGRLKTQQEMLKPLGMWEVRSKRLRKMTEQYLTWDKREASDLHGIGKYGSDSYQIFFHDHIPPNVEDKELKKYIDKLLG